MIFKSKFFLFIILSALFFMPVWVIAQEGAVSGKVTNEQGDGLPGANVSIQGENIGAATNTDGEFTITGVPVGQRSIIARFIGYKTLIQVVDVTAGEVTAVDFKLAETVLDMDEVVVTGVGIETEKKKLGNTVGTINIKEIEAAPVSSLSEILQAREVGVNVLPSSGLVGEGSRIRIRGSSSLSQSNEPIVYIDGIRVDNGGGFAGTVYAGGGGSPSRLDDINPESIDRIEILKGSAAATLYGTQAANGIIQIFTKQGQFSKPKFTFEVEQSTINYSGDAYKPNVGFARPVDEDDVPEGEDPEFFQRNNMREVFGDPSIDNYQLVTRENVNNLMGTGLTQTYSMSVSGGGSGVTYFASGRYQNTNGPFDPGPEDFLGEEPGPAQDKLSRGQFSGTVNIVPTSKLRIRLGTLYSNVEQETLQNNNNIYGVVSLAMFGKPEFVTKENPQGTVAFATVRETTHAQTKDETNHAAVSVSTSYKFQEGLVADATFGIDFVSQRSSEFRPFGWDVDDFTGFVTDGALSIGKREHKEWTLDLKSNWNRNFTSDISSAFITGFQGYISTSQISGSDVDLFPGPGLEVLDAGANQTTYSIFSEVKEAGLYLQEQIGFKEYLYLTGGARFDANSAFGTEFQTQTYPKFGVSFIPTTALDMSNALLSTLRLRAGWGKSGQQPGAFDQFTTFSPQTSEEGAGLAPENLGDPTIKPEVSTEIEMGFEMGLLNEKLGFEFTYWDRVVKDALVQRSYAPSGGFRLPQLSNIGQLDANGLDININFSLMRGENLSIDLFANTAHLSETLTSLGGAPEQKVAGSYSRIRNYLREGYAPGSFFGARLPQAGDYIVAPDLDENENIIPNTGVKYEAGQIPISIDGDNIPESQAELLAYFADPHSPSSWSAVLAMGPQEFDFDPLSHYLGKPTPDWQGAFGFNIGFMKNFRLSTLFEYKTGDYTITNLTDAFRKSHPAIGRNTPDAAATELILLDPNSTAEQRLDAAVKWENTYRALAPYSGLNTMEDASFIRIREVSLSYEVPSTVTSRLGLSNASLTFSGRNLHIFTGYTGIDPELNWAGRNGFGNETAGAQDTLDNNFLDGVDAFGLPIPRQFILKLRAGF